MSDRKKIVRVRHVMSENFVTIDGIATVSDALQVMKTSNTTVLVVKKRHADDEYGLITANDIAQHVLARDRAPTRVNVYEIMAKPVISVHPEMDIRYCSRLFATYDLVCAPVMDGREIIGLIKPDALVMKSLFHINQ